MIKAYFNRIFYLKTLGVIGGMSWESTSVYYRLLNQGVRDRLGGLYSARMLLYSVEFNEIVELQHCGNWPQAAAILAQAAQSLEKAGAQGLLIATNTMHKVADQVSVDISMPLLHIADSTAKAIVAQGYQQVGLLATAFTMEDDFYSGHIRSHYDIDVIVPDARDRGVVHNVIYNQLCQGVVEDESRQQYLRIIDSLSARGAQAVILGCTEIDLLISQADSDMPLFDSTALHAADAVDWMLGEGG